VTSFPIVLADSSRMRLLTATRLYPWPECSNTRLVPLNSALIASKRIVGSRRSRVLPFFPAISRLVILAPRRALPSSACNISLTRHEGASKNLIMRESRGSAFSSSRMLKNAVFH
jgi:hypothetical protein